MRAAQRCLYRENLIALPDWETSGRSPLGLSDPAVEWCWLQRAAPVRSKRRHRAHLPPAQGTHGLPGVSEHPPPRGCSDAPSSGLPAVPGAGCDPAARTGTGCWRLPQTRGSSTEQLGQSAEAAACSDEGNHEVSRHREPRWRNSAAVPPLDGLSSAWQEAREGLRVLAQPRCRLIPCPRCGSNKRRRIRGITSRESCAL